MTEHRDARRPRSVAANSTIRRPNSERVRVLSNYARLAAGFVIGLWVLRTLVGLGTDAFAVVVLFTAGLGLHVLIREILLSGLTPALSAAWNHRSPDRLPLVFASVRRIATAMAGCGVLIYAALFVAVPWLKVAPEFVDAAKMFVVARAVPGVLSIAFAPSLVLYLASGRVAEHNLFTFGERASELAAALVAVTFFAADPANAIMAFGGIAAALQSLVMTAAVVRMRWTSPQLRRVPAVPVRMQVAVRQSVIKSVTANASMILVIALYIRTDLVLVNILVGPVATAVLGFAVQVSGYVRVVTSGLTVGLESVAARTQRVGNGLVDLFRRSLFAQAFVVAPATVFLAINAEATIDAIVGSRIDDRSLLPTIAWTLQLLLLSVAARGLTDGWVRLIAGLGKVDDVVRPAFRIAIWNPPIVVGLWIAGVDNLVAAAAIVFAVSLAILNLVVVPTVAARVTGATATRLLLPAIGPIVASLLAMPALRIFSQLSADIAGLPLIVSVALAALSYGVVYSTLIAVGLVIARRRQRSNVQPTESSSASQSAKCLPESNHSLLPLAQPSRRSSQRRSA